MTRVDTFFKQNNYSKYSDDFKSHRKGRIHPNPLFQMDKTDYSEDEATEVCPCCIEANSGQYDLEDELCDL